MNHAQKYLVQANRQTAELTVQMARQRVVVKHALDTGQHLEMAESLLDALEGSIRIFEKHRIFLLSLSEPSRACRRVTRDRPELVTTQRVWSVVPESRIRAGRQFLWGARLAFEEG